MTYETQPPNFTPSFYAYLFEFWLILRLMPMAALKFHQIGNPIIPCPNRNLVEVESL
jgi:hypothetical protein